MPTTASTIVVPRTGGMSLFRVAPAATVVSFKLVGDALVEALDSRLG